MRVKLVIGFQHLAITIMRSPTVNHIKRPCPYSLELNIVEYTTYFYLHVACRASKRNFASRNKTALEPQGQTETSLKIEDLRANKTTCNEMMAFLITV